MGENPDYERRLKATMRGLSLDLDRLYTLSFQRFSHPITHNTARGNGGTESSSTRLIICLDDDEDVVTGKDPLSSSQARRTWHAQRNGRISEAAQTMYPKDMFHEEELIIGPDGTVRTGERPSDEGYEDKEKDLASTSSRSVVHDKDRDDEAKSTTFKRFEQSAILDCESDATSLLLFHPFEAVLVMSDLRDGLSVWNYGSGKKLSRFSNCNRPGTRITSLAWINEQEPTRLMTGSDDGVVRVWCGTSMHTTGGKRGVDEVEERQETVFQALEQAGFISGGTQSNNTTDALDMAASGIPLSLPGLDSRPLDLGVTRKDIGMPITEKFKTKNDVNKTKSGVGPAQMLTAWKGAHDINPGARGSGLILKWQQLSGRLFAAGNSSVIRVWDLNREQCVSTIPSGCDTCVTSIGSDWNSAVGGGEGVILCGYGDGSLRLFDARLPPEQANVFGFSEHQTWVVNVEMQRGGGKHIISGSVSGDIKFWDIRGHRQSSIKTIELHRSPMTALAVHEFAPIVASGSHNQFIKIMDTGGNLISMIRYHEGFLGQRIGPVSCLEFHPHRPVLAAGATDSIVAIYSSRGKV